MSEARHLSSIMEVMPGSEENNQESVKSPSPQPKKEGGLTESAIEKAQDNILIKMNSLKKRHTPELHDYAIENPILQLNPNLKNKAEVKSTLAAL